MNFDKTLQKYRKFIQSKAYYYYVADGSYDDLYQEGCIGLMEAVEKYDNNKSSSFNYYAKMVVTRRIIDAVRKSTYAKHNFLTHARRDEYLIHRNGTFISPEMYVILKERLEELNLILTELEKISFFMEWEGYSYIEIARTLGSSDRRKIDNAITRARKKIKNKLGGYYECYLCNRTISKRPRP